MILNKGYKSCVLSSNGKDAIEKTKSIMPDMILMDIKIDGDLDGIETMEEIRKFSQVPVIFISGNSDDQTFKRASQVNNVDFFTKPVDYDKLLQAMEKHFHKEDELK